MNIFMIGVNFKTAPLKIRETFSLQDTTSEGLMCKIIKEHLADECVIISTCNRTEIYFYGNQGINIVPKIEKALCDQCGVDLYNNKKYFYVFSGEGAVKHLFRVTCGLDSLILGEDQILGQVKGAHNKAKKIKAAGTVLNTLFRDAITAAKKVKTDTLLSKSSVSYGCLAAKLAQEIFKEDFSDKTVMVIGSGEIGSIVIKSLIDKGLKNILLTKRSHDPRNNLDNEYLKVIDYEKRYDHIDKCDMVISSTASPHYTITRDLLEQNIQTKKQRLFIDLAVPRDIDESLSSLENIELINIDDLSKLSCENMEVREQEAVIAQNILDEYIDKFERAYKFRKIVPDLSELRDDVRKTSYKKVVGILSNTEKDFQDDKEIAHKVSHIIDDYMTKMIFSIRDNAPVEDIEAFYRCLISANPTDNNI